MSGEILFKNKARQFKQPQKRYTPEYERLNMQPAVEKRAPRVAVGASFESGRSRPSDGGNLSEFEVGPSEGVNRPPGPEFSAASRPNIMIPRQVRVSSGANQEHTWIDKSLDIPKNESYKKPPDSSEETNDVAPGDFVVMYQGKIMFVGQELDAEEFVWEMISTLESPSSDDINQILVLKRLPIKIGASFVQ